MKNWHSSSLVPFSWLALVLLLDQASKALVEGRFALYEIKVVIPGLFNLTHLLNTGAAFVEAMHKCVAGAPAAGGSGADAA